MNINPKIFKAYDIRGIYPTDIDEAKFEAVIRGIYTFFVRDLKKEKLSVVLGRDMRTMSPSLFEVAKKALVNSGASVVDIGMVSTPTFYYASLKYGHDVGIQVTASHNPKEWAGTKFVKRDGNKIIKIGKNQGMEQVKENVLNDDFVPYTNDGTVIIKENVLEDDVNDALKSVDVSKLRPFKVVCDPANGMGGEYVQKLFEKIPGELIKINFDPDGTFPNHPADPLDFNNLIPLQEKVKETGADLGVEPDGDGDRIFFVNEKGNVIEATFITSLIAKEELQKKSPETIVVDIRYVRNVSNVVKQYGGKTFVTKVGHAFITENVNKESAVFAGESSGHFFFRATGGAESSVRVLLYVLMAMSEQNKPISEILESLHSSFESGEINFILPENIIAKELLEEIGKEHPDAEISWLDGISVDYPDWRFNIRTSNTEPLMRLNVESDSKEKTAEKFEMIIERIKKSGATVKSLGH